MSGAEGLGPVLVTGAARRIGLALAKGFAEIGRPVILHASPRSLREATAAAGALRARGARAETVAADLSDALEARGLIERAESVFGPLTLLVNNASVFRHDFPGAAEPDALAESLAVHALAPFMLIEAAARAKPAQARLDVFNILDQKLLNLNADYYSYTLGKAALMAMTQMWGLAGRADVRVFGLAPGLMFPSGPQNEARFQADSAKIPTGRATPAEQICAAIGFFLANTGVPGQILPVDGGEHLAPRLRDMAFE